MGVCLIEIECKVTHLQTYVQYLKIVKKSFGAVILQTPYACSGY